MIMPILAESIKTRFSVNAKLAMNIDMVKPTPAKIDIPTICQ
jgi:hypothetical protein